MTSVPTLLPIPPAPETALPESISELTQALQTVLQQYLPFIPEEVSVFFGGAEVYRYIPADDSVCWWGGYWSDPEAPVAPSES